MLKRQAKAHSGSLRTMHCWSLRLPCRVWFNVSSSVLPPYFSTFTKWPCVEWLKWRKSPSAEVVGKHWSLQMKCRECADVWRTRTGNLSSSLWPTAVKVCTLLLLLPLPSQIIEGNVIKTKAWLFSFLQLLIPQSHSSLTAPTESPDPSWELRE